MIVRRKKPVFPQACVLSNASGNLAKYSMVKMSTFGNWLAIVVSQVPALGFMLMPIVVFLSLATGRAYQCNLRMRYRTFIFLTALEISISVMFIPGNCLSAIGLLLGNYYIAGLGLMISLCAAAGFWMYEHFLFRTHVLSPEYIAIEGINADYLDRLPEFPYPTNHKIFTRP
ncbi:MAG: hypothetical protein JXM70_11340 [Pirellulales bacterium]|nr:hypothetical protein [Pirellulales bacterium]